MSSDPPNPVTQLLAAASAGDATAQDRLWATVYDELRRLAHGQLAHDACGVALQTTVLVHEAYLRLLGPEGNPANWENRRHFFAAAAEAMRRIRVDDARTRKRLKRGGGQAPQPLIDEAGADGGDPDELLAIDDALNKLAALDARKAEVVKLRFFAGLSVDETANALGVSPRTVDNEWRFARAWLHRELSAE